MSKAGGLPRRPAPDAPRPTVLNAKGKHSKPSNYQEKRWVR